MYPYLHNARNPSNKPTTRYTPKFFHRLACTRLFLRKARQLREACHVITCIHSQATQATNRNTHGLMSTLQAAGVGFRRDGK
jgi:hypothetical protein